MIKTFSFGRVFENDTTRTCKISTPCWSVSSNLLSLTTNNTGGGKKKIITCHFAEQQSTFWFYKPTFSVILNSTVYVGWRHALENSHGKFLKQKQDDIKWHNLYDSPIKLSHHPALFRTLVNLFNNNVWRHDTWGWYELVDQFLNTSAILLFVRTYTQLAISLSISSPLTLCSLSTFKFAIKK